MKIQCHQAQGTLCPTRGEGGNPDPKDPHPELQPVAQAPAPGTHVILLVLEDGGVEGPLLPLLGGQGDLTAEPPGEDGRGWASGAGCTPRSPQLP